MTSKEELVRLQLARRILEKELKREITINDDNNVSSMYDLRVGPADTPEIAIECVGAVDQIFTETWNIGPEREPLLLSIKGDWKIVIAREAKVKKIRQRVERLILTMEDRGIYNARVDHFLKRHDEELFIGLKSLGITHAYCFRSVGTGEVHLGMSGISGSVDDRGSAVPKWIGEFLNNPKQKDVLNKLDNSGALECHVFIPVEFDGAPWEVYSYLSGNIKHLPTENPNLPPPIIGVWIVSLVGSHGIRWDGVEWRLFDFRNDYN